MHITILIDIDKNDDHNSDDDDDKLYTTKGDETDLMDNKTEYQTTTGDNENRTYYINNVFFL